MGNGCSRMPFLLINSSTAVKPRRRRDRNMLTFSTSHRSTAVVGAHIPISMSEVEISSSVLFLLSSKAGGVGLNLIGGIK
jgi:hypothetical protein